MAWMVLTISALVLFTTSMYNPSILADNKFIDGISSHEIVAILIVILTVTMASIANIHLTLGRIKDHMSQNNIDISVVISQARKELNENSSYMFFSFCFLLFILFIKGMTVSTIFISFIHSGVILVTILNLLILYDIYKSVYLLTSLDE